MPILVLGIIIVGIIVLTRHVVVVKESYVYVIEALGAYKTTWEVGLHIKTPFIDRIAKKVSMKEQIIDFEPTSVITKDNVTVTVDSLVFFQVTDPQSYTYGVDRPVLALSQLTNTTLRQIFGSLDFDDALTSRDVINSRAREILDTATDPWGIKVNRVELKQIAPPKDVQDAMERQMKAEREKREKILRSEGNKQSAVLEAEGAKQSAILNAEAAKEVKLLNAEADKEVKLLNAEADAQAKLKRAKADAEATLVLRQAQANGYAELDSKLFNGAAVQMRSLEALEKVADGKSTKIIIPSEIQNLAGLLTAGKELLNTDTVEVEDKTPREVVGEVHFSKDVPTVNSNKTSK